MKNELLLTLISSAEFGFAYHDILTSIEESKPDYKFVNTNPSFERIIGLSASDINGKTINQLVENNEVTNFDWASLYQRFSAALSNHVVEEFFPYTGKWYSIQIHKPNPCTLITVYTDITTAKQLELLRASEVMYRQIFENANDAIFLMSGDKFIDCNPKTLDIFGCNRDNIIGHEPYMFSPTFQPDGFPSTDKALEKIYAALSGIPQRFEWVHSKLDGTLFDAEVSLNSFISLSGEKWVQAIVRDISDRKRAEKEQYMSKEFRNRVLESSHTPIVILNPKDQKIIDCNPAAIEIYRFKTKQEVIGKTPLDVSAPTQYDGTPSSEKVSYYIELARNTPSVTFEWKHQRPNGDQWDAEVHLLSFRIGNDLYMQFSLTDITERKIAQEKLYFSENRYRLLLTNISDSISVVDISGTQKYVSPSVEKQTGYSANELQGTTIAQVVHPDDLPLVLEKWRSLLEYPNATSSATYRHIHKTKGWIYLEAVGVNLLHEPSINGVILNIRDITERLRTEKTLKDIIEKNPMSIQIVDKDGLTLQVNNSHTKLFGAIPPPTYSIFNDPIIEKQGLIPLFDKVRNGEVVYFPDFYYNVHDLLTDFKNKPLWIRMVVFPLLDPSGTPEQFVLIHDNITERKEHEAELATINEELTATSEALRENNASLQEAKEKAEESDRLKSVFLANISHEVRTPMNAILGFLELLKNPNLENIQKESYISIINLSGQRLLSTINDIVEISKIEANQLDVVNSEVNIHETIQYLYTVFHPSCQGKGLTLKVDERVNRLNVFAVTDKYKLEGILSNIINNAIKFTETGSIELISSIEADRMVFVIKDTGIGIPSDRLEAIFERFVHADLNNTRPYEGSGLGLAIAKAYTEMLNGSIRVESEVGKGSTFTITLPYQNSRKEAGSSSNNLIQENPKEQKVKILIAEDDEYSYRLIESMIQHENIELFHTTNGDETIKCIMEIPDICMVLMDIKMPKLNGLEATKQIRKFNKEIPIVAQTAYAMAGDRESAIEAGCTDYITKPILQAELLRLIRKYSKNG